MTNKLIVFYSRADENYVNGQLKMLPVGNTEMAADMIRELTAADVFKIEQVNPYARDYNTCIAEAQEDQRRDTCPALKALPEGMDEYNVIYLGYPNYWNTMPMAVFTFLESLDFTKKTICPFCTHEGSGMGASEADIRKLCPDAIIKKGLAIHGSSVTRSKKIIEKWIGGLER